MKPRINSPLTKLDKWDIAFICLFKSNTSTSAMLNAIPDLWAERCCVDPNKARLPYIVEYLANLIDNLNLTPRLFTVISEMRPDRDWYWGVPEGADEATRAICVMASWLRHTEVKYLPGYAESIVLDDVSQLANRLKTEAIRAEQEENPYDGASIGPAEVDYRV